MWKSINGSLVHTTDVSRVKFRTNVSRSVLENLKRIASENDTHVNYLLETGLQEVLSQGVITFNKDLRPKDRIQYKTTYDKELLENVKAFAKKHSLYINDVFEYSANFVDIEKSKKKEFRYRTE